MPDNIISIHGDGGEFKKKFSPFVYGLAPLTIEVDSEFDMLIATTYNITCVNQ